MAQQERRTPSAADIEAALTKASRPSMSWGSMAFQFLLSVFVAGTVSVIFVYSTAEKEAKEAASAVSDEMCQKIDALATSVRVSQEATGKSLEQLARSVEAMAGKQEAMSEAILKLTVSQAVTETKLESRNGRKR